MAILHHHVAEMQGLYGPFTMAERVVQKIWLQRDFDQTGVVLTDGRTLKVRSTGVWNLLGGPDFHAARLLIGGRETTGDVEVHFRAADWRAHGHETDPAYDQVALHVVLFPLNAEEKPALSRGGQPIPTLVLLPLLHRDLEEYASDDALETLTARDEWWCYAELAVRPRAELQEMLRGKARERWRQKVYFAGVRIEKLGWHSALHHAALEILGYRQNRAAMLEVATRYPLEMWVRGIEAHIIFEENKTLWQLQGVRPANQPLRRLLQYQRWVTASPDWPDQILPLFHHLPVDVSNAVPTKHARQIFGLGECRRIISRDLLSGALSGARMDNLVCDGLLPLLAARTKKDFFGLWFHWFLGDVPDQVRRTLPKLALADRQLQPLCHGYARGLLSWFLECEARASS